MGSKKESSISLSDFEGLYERLGVIKKQIG